LVKGCINCNIWASGARHLIGNPSPALRLSGTADEYSLNIHFRYPQHLVLCIRSFHFARRKYRWFLHPNFPIVGSGFILAFEIGFIASALFLGYVCCDT